MPSRGYSGGLHKPESFNPEAMPKQAGSGKGIARRRFIAWDGEAVRIFCVSSAGEIEISSNYCLFGNSEGMEVCGLWLSTVDFLEFLLEAGDKYPSDFHIGFVLDYDLNNLLKDLPKFHLIMLKERNRCNWNGYTITHYPRKSFTVRHGSRHIRLDDIFTFFRSPYCTNDPDNLGALDKYKVSSPEVRRRIAEGKGVRKDFTWAEIEEIKEYFRLELATMPPLMDKIRECCEAAGMHILRWYGTGALAKYELSKHKASQHLCPTPEFLMLPVRYAYGGGWFERFKAGAYVPEDFTTPCFWTADINSAYAYAMSLLPSLANGEWEWIEGERSRDYAKAKQFGVYHIRYGQGSSGLFNTFARTSHGIPLPLFQRSYAGNISHPLHGDSWFWDPEAFAVHSNRDTEFLGSWILRDMGERPFEWVADMFDTRLILQRAGDPAEKALKWCLACLYGTFAQRTGWNRRTRTAPRYHQLEYAGWITSLCRMMIYAAVRKIALAGGLVSIDTDGFISSVKPEEKSLQRGIGEGLGQWKIEEFSGLIYFQNGVYWLRDMQGNWVPPKTRGIPRGQIGSADNALTALSRTGKFQVTQRHFVGYGAAIARGNQSVWRTWEEQPHDIDLNSIGSRQHVETFCRACRKGLKLNEALHDLALTLPSRTEQETARPHFLPWLEPPDDDKLKERLRHEIEEHYTNEVFG